MRLPPLYGTVYKRPPRAVFFRKWVRIAFWIAVFVIALNYGIHGYFWLMAHIVDGIAAWSSTP